MENPHFFGRGVFFTLICEMNVVVASSQVLQSKYARPFGEAFLFHFYMFASDFATLSSFTLGI